MKRGCFNHALIKYASREKVPAFNLTVQQFFHTFAKDGKKKSDDLVYTHAERIISLRIALCIINKKVTTAIAIIIYKSLQIFVNNHCDY